MWRSHWLEDPSQPTSLFHLYIWRVQVSVHPRLQGSFPASSYLMFLPICKSMGSTLLSTGIRFSVLPESYVRPEQERPRLSQVRECKNVPIIDIGNRVNRQEIIRQIHHACQHYGFFQVINHGVPEDMMTKMMAVAAEFFQLPVEEKMKLYSTDPAKTVRLSTSFNVSKETVHNWRDYLRLHCYPLDQYAPEWPSNPPSFR